jgi:hypothetical protein
MASEVYINIKDLPELSQINNGDYIIVETSTGTHILNFENLLLPTANTVITTTVNQNASAFTTSSVNLSTAINLISSFSTDTATNLNTLSSSFTTYQTSLSGISNLNIGKNQILIKSGDYTASKIISLVGTTYSTDNILITPANKYAALYPAYVDAFDFNTGLITIRGTFNNKTIVYNSGNIGITSSATSTDSLSNYNVANFTNSLSVNNANLNNLLNTFSLSTVYTPAQEDAVYNVYVIKT